MYHRRQLWVVSIFNWCLQHTKLIHMRDWLESCSSIDLAAAFLVLSSGEASQIPTWMRRCRDWNCILELWLLKQLIFLDFSCICFLLWLIYLFLMLLFELLVFFNKLLNTWFQFNCWHIAFHNFLHHLC